MTEEKQRTYIAIDLKSFYASAECVERGYDPLKTNLVVADKSRTDKTICLAVSPSLKAYGIAGRARLFEVVQRVKEINEERLKKAPGNRFTGSSIYAEELAADPSLSLDYCVAVPRMAHYIEVSTHIYEMYLKYISPEDIHVYSIDEVFIDATDYLKMYGLSAHELVMKLIQDVLSTTGITATGGIGPNLYLCKIAMDIEAKHQPADKDGVRIAELTERSYREKYWNHRPLTDFWRVGGGIARRLESVGIFTMGDIARCSLQNEDLLFQLFGVNAELLIDHAWGTEPCTMADIKNYRSVNNSNSVGQVLMEPYPYEKARIVVREMADQLAYDLAQKRQVTDLLVLSVGYDIENLKDPQKALQYQGEVKADHYGRIKPKSTHGSISLQGWTAANSQLVGGALQLFDSLAERSLTVRRIGLDAAHVLPAWQAEKQKEQAGEQMDLFEEIGEETEKQKNTDAEEKEKRRQEAILSIRKRFGKNAVFMGTDMEDGATTLARNEQIGGHRA